jgi:leader peptidase (prepilin peptidase)/N-methyltransferase
MSVIWIVFLAVFGACVGSFLNVVIYRLPRGQSIVFPGSHCPTCGRAIRWHDNIPLVSWLVLRCRCRWCRKPISPRYFLIEAATAVLLAGLYAWYFLLHLRRGAGDFALAWPMYVAHAALLCGLLAAAVVDIEHWIVPLEVCWTVSGVGLLCSAASPHSFMPRVSPAAGAMALAAAAGLVLAMLMVRYGLIRRSFIDAQEKPLPAEAPGHGSVSKPRAGQPSSKRKPVLEPYSKAHGVNPRLEVLREVLFLAPSLVLAGLAYLLVARVEAVGDVWRRIAGEGAGAVAVHFRALLASLFGYLLGGLWIWGARIVGTLAFGKEAMGMGDVHLMAAVGAVTGWIVPSVAFFVAPFMGLLWALYLLASRNQRQLPYGPWLAAGTLVVMLFYDRFREFLAPFADALR